MTDPARRFHVIVDRDGVLNREPDEGWLASPADWIWEDGALEGLAALAAAAGADGSTVAVSVATNQSGIGRGVVAEADVAALHEWLAASIRDLGVDLVGIFVCPHAPDAGCRCRKPAPGLLLDAIAASGVPPEHTVFVGDASRDLAAAHAAGVAPILVRTGKGRATAARAAADATLDVADDLRAAVTIALTRMAETGEPSGPQ